MSELVRGDANRRGSVCYSDPGGFASSLDLFSTVGADSIIKYGAPNIKRCSTEHCVIWVVACIGIAYNFLF